jgi:hypothetical protein
MEAFDQKESTKSNHKRRSGNPEFEIEFTVESRGSSGESEEEEAQGRREASIPLTAPKIHGGAEKSPWGEIWGGGGGLERVRNFRVRMGRRRALNTPAKGAGRPGGLQRRPGRPERLCRSTRRLTEPPRATRAPVAERPGSLQYRSGSTGQSCQLTRPAQKRSMET